MARGGVNALDRLPKMLLILGASGILPAALAAIVRHLILSRERRHRKPSGLAGDYTRDVKTALPMLTLEWQRSWGIKGQDLPTEEWMPGYLTTHVLDTARGRPAEGMEVVLYRLDGATRTELARLVTNADGRTDRQILPAEDFATGRYELEFHAGAWMDATGIPPEKPRFLDVIPIRFGMSQDDHYHVPLLVSPFGYSTYRGS